MLSDVRDKTTRTEARTTDFDGGRREVLKAPGSDEICDVEQKLEDVPGDVLEFVDPSQSLSVDFSPSSSSECRGGACFDPRSFGSFDDLRGTFDRGDVLAFRFGENDWRALVPDPMEGPEHGGIIKYIEKDIWKFETDNEVFATSFGEDFDFAPLTTQSVEGYVVYDAEADALRGTTISLMSAEGDVLGTYAVAQEARNVVVDCGVVIRDFRLRQLHFVPLALEIEVTHRRLWQAMGHGFELLRILAILVYGALLFEVPEGSERGDFKALAYLCRRQENGRYTARFYDFGTIPYLARRQETTFKKCLAILRRYGVDHVEGLEFDPPGATLATATSFRITARAFDPDDLASRNTLLDALEAGSRATPADLVVPLTYAIDGPHLSLPGSTIHPTDLSIPLYPLLLQFATKFL